MARAMRRYATGFFVLSVATVGFLALSAVMGLVEDLTKKKPITVALAKKPPEYRERMAKDPKCKFRPYKQYKNRRACLRHKKRAVAELLKKPPKTSWDHDRELFMRQVEIGACRDLIEDQANAYCAKIKPAKVGSVK